MVKAKRNKRMKNWKKYSINDVIGIARVAVNKIASKIVKKTQKQ